MSEDLKELKKNWDEFARKDPLWSILPIPDKKGNRWDIKELFETGKAEIKTVMACLRELNIRIERGKALDFGCGVGRLSQALCEHFDACIGIDISKEMIRLALQYNKYGKRCRYIVNERPDLKILADNDFDFIYSNIVFQHMPPELALGYIGEFIRVVRPRGVVVFQVAVSVKDPSTRVYRFMNRAVPRCLRKLYKRWRYGTWAIKDMYCIDEDRLKKHIGSCGGDVIDVTEDRSSLPRYGGRKYIVGRKKSSEQREKERRSRG
jgi:ubiquinone/menaquinone biosynthesis C-methylase UbiE